MLGKLLNFIEKIDTRPIKIEEKCCTKIISSKSNRSACQDICSQNAIIIDDEEIRIDFDKCNQCGLCVNSCPNQVFNLEIDSEINARKNFTLLSKIKRYVVFVKVWKESYKNKDIV